jgi:pimeloyl-[acyl-carrier protein] methyl ester esterase
MNERLFSQSFGHGQDIVLLHGWGVNSGVWENISKTLGQYYRITLVDLPGFGRNTDLFPDDYTIASVAYHVSDCLPKNCVLLGWSLGGLVAQQIAIQGAVDLKQLILVATSPKFVAAPEWPGIQPQVLAMFEKQLEGNFSKTLDRFLAIQALGSETARQDMKVIKAQIEQFPLPHAHALQNGLKILAETDLRTQLARIAVPTSRLYGRLDSLVPAKSIELIQQLQPDSQQIIFAKASHAPFISHPAEFVAKVRQLVV